MIPLAVATWFKTNPRNVWLIVALVVLVIVLATVYFKGRSDAHAKDEARQKIAVAAALKSDDKADSQARAAIVGEAVAIDAQTKELENAVAKVPDSAPDAVAVAAGCVELRQHGISTANLPACRATGK